MDMNELEREIINLAKEIRKENLPKSVVPATLDILQYSSPPGKKQGEGVRQSLIPILATLLLLLLFIPVFSFNSEPALNVIRLILLLFSIATGTALFFRPEIMAEIDRISRCSARSRA